MVAFTDLKVYRSTSDLGGAITATQIQTATSNNLFTNVPRSDYVAGATYYKCIYWKNTHATESMDDFKLWLSGSTPSPNTKLELGFETGYRFAPNFTTNGSSTFDSTTSTSALQLTRFTVCAWFNTSADFASRGYIINKGGEGTDGTPGENDNYSIAMNSNETIRAGFEETDGTDHYATSPLTYNDGLSHFVLMYYDGTQVALFIDDMTTPVATHSTSATPESSGTNPVVVGRNSRTSVNFFGTGWIDECRIWNRAMTSATERESLKINNAVNPSGLVYENKFGSDTGVVTAQTIANVNTAPINITWYDEGEIPPSLGRISAGASFPTWIKLTVTATATADPAIDDSGIFTAQFDIPQGGTGTGGSGGSGGGTGGNPPPTNTDYKVCFAGDWGCEPETDDVIDLIQTQDYDLVVGVGDNAYESASCWTSRFTPLKTIMISAYGNHEYSESGGTGPYKTFLGRSSTFYTHRFQNIFFLVLDSNDDRSGVDLDAQVTWATEQLEAVKNDSTITWRIAVMHHPWFGASSDHSYNEFDQVQKFHKLFTDYRVSFVYVGHNHNWQRTHQVAYNSGSPTSPTIIDSSSPYLRTAAGLIHVVTGTGGHDSGGSLYGLGSQPGYQAYQNRTHNGVHELVASNNGQTLTGQFRDTSGDIYDTFTITA